MITVEQFRIAAGRGDRRDFETISTAAAYLPINSKDELGYSALHYCCRSSSLYQAELALILLDCGANPNCLTANKVTPLHLCCFGAETAALADAKMQTIKHLLASGADVMLRDHAGVLPIHLAASSGLNDAVKTFVKQTAEIHRVPWWRSGSEPVFKCPYVLMCDRFGKRAFDWAIDCGQESTVKLLFLCEYGYAFEMLRQQLAGGSVDPDYICECLSLSAADMKVVEWYVRKTCSVQDDSADTNRNSIRSFSDTTEGIRELQELMNEPEGSPGATGSSEVVISREIMDELSAEFKRILRFIGTVLV